jgi:hypothetical protein
MNKFLHDFLKVSVLFFLLATIGAGCIEIQEDTSGARTDGLPRLVSGCGDKVCDDFEKTSNKCPQDCNIAAIEEQEAPKEDPTKPLYVTIVLHNEEDKQGDVIKEQIPNYDGNKELLTFYTSTLRAFGEMVSGHGAKINFGSDWTFSDGITNFDNRFYLDMENMGHEIDAHAHESSVKYHEVRQKISTAGGTPTHIASGIAENSLTEHFTYFNKYYPEFNILWGIANPGHGDGESIAGWVWRPSENDWTKHDPMSKYIYIGGGERINSFKAIKRALDSRKPDRINTYTLFVSPRDFKADIGENRIPAEFSAEKDAYDYWANRIIWWDDLLYVLEEFVETGDIKYASLSEIANIYIENEENLTPHSESIPRSTAPISTRNRAEGYIR